ncbi:MAG: hypothetical protein FD130_581 [Halothiobacillaceae bacterium]|nr:MAG: hypothetical protein FD130_581 [Halothiobacillaceae bacterium]
MSPPPTLVTALLNPAPYDHEVVQPPQLLETHISWVILTGPYAYKIKKPVNFGFLDFSTLAKRQENCLAELRLNRRLAPQLYLEVVSWHGTPDNPTLRGTGPVIEYAVKMRQFDPQQQLDRLLVHHQLSTSHIDALASEIAHFHAACAVAPLASPYGDLHSTTLPVADNFAQIRHYLSAAADLATLTALEQWSDHFIATHAPLFEQRKQGGFIRECHGDLHLRNITLIEERPVIFDCIEFSDALRWIDTINDMAFLIMDLRVHQRGDLAQRFLNGYLEQTGDYAGIRLLPFYLVYRALVRCKIALIEREQQGNPAEAHTHHYRQYLRLAQQFITPVAPVLMVMHGLSGSGKSVVSQLIAQHSKTIRVRSDVERKRLYGAAPYERPTALQQKSLYASSASQRTYARLVELAEIVLTHGYHAIVDATFLKLEQRILFQQLAKRLGCEFIILHLDTPIPLLKQRLVARQQQNSDPSDATLAVLEQQLQQGEALTSSEKEHTITLNTAHASGLALLPESLHKTLCIALYIPDK